ncbi:transmembrane transport protein [Micromonospora sp. NPDC050397]|uniref:transmembrane transport protein n=1 Tax=Micromonospora sp. NPDC050397 TaxID=3364279 RepID=UPI00384A8A26
MIWMSWRQFRVQALIGTAALALVAAYLLYLGADIRDAYDAYRIRCQSQGDCGVAMARFHGDYQNTLLFLAAGFGLVPVLIGAFWGAPLIAREWEAGTHRLVWNQSVTRRRWLVVRLTVVALASMIVVGVISALLTWAASPVDRVAEDRFSTIVFGARNVVPIGYAAFAFMLGAVVGLLVRRTLPAMAITFLAVIVVQVAAPNLVRPHLMPAEEVAMPMTASAVNGARGLGSITGAAVVKGLSVPDAWVTRVSELRTSDGKDLSREKFDDCFGNPPKTGATGTFGDTAVCLGELDLHVDVAYQPDDRYWTFQWVESAMYLTLAVLLLAFGLWRVEGRRVIS